MKQGYGGGVWFSAAFLKLNIAVAHGRGSSTRMHVGAQRLVLTSVGARG